MEALFKELANILNITVETLKLNGETYILEFAKYEFISNIGASLIFGFVLGTLVLFVTVGILSCVEDETLENLSKKQDRMLVTIVIVIILISVFTPLFLEWLKYSSSPMIYGLENLIETLK